MKCQYARCKILWLSKLGSEMERIVHFNVGLINEPPSMLLYKDLQYQLVSLPRYQK